MKMLNDIELVRTPEYSKAARVLDALYKGMEVVLDDKKIRLAKNVYDSEEPICICDSNVGKTFVGLGDWSMRNFIQACNKLTEEDLMILSANIVLNDMDIKNDRK